MSIKELEKIAAASVKLAKSGMYTIKVDADKNIKFVKYNG